MGDVQISAVSGVIDLLLSNIIIPLANSVLNKGFPLPTVAGVTFTDSRIVLENGVFLLATAFNIG